MSVYNMVTMRHTKKLAEIGPDKVNKAYAHIKFYCQPMSEV